jgi:hypothetical protein
MRKICQEKLGISHFISFNAVKEEECKCNQKPVTKIGLTKRRKDLLNLPRYLQPEGLEDSQRILRRWLLQMQQL